MHKLKPFAGVLGHQGPCMLTIPPANRQGQTCVLLFGSCSTVPCSDLRLSQQQKQHAQILRVSEQQHAETQLSGLSQADGRTPPWSFHFQHNERYLEWSESAQEQLLKLHIAEKLGVDKNEVGLRLQHLDLILPDLVQRLPRLKADLLLKLLTNTETLGSKLLVLKTAFPRVNIGCLAARFPVLLTDFDIHQLAEKAQKLRAHLPGVDVDELMDREPMVFNADVPRVLADVQRLLGKSVDPLKYFVANPREVLDMQQGGLPSSAETGSDHAV